MKAVAHYDVTVTAKSASDAHLKLVHDRFDKTTDSVFDSVLLVTSPDGLVV